MRRVRTSKPWGVQAVADACTRATESDTGRALRVGMLIWMALFLPGLLAGQGKAAARGSAPIRISGGKVRIGDRPAGSLRSLSDRAGLARVIANRLERVGDARASRFRPDADRPDRSGGEVRPSRGGYYDPYGYYRSPGYAGLSEDARYDPRSPRRSTAPAPPPALGRAYGLRGPPSFTPIRLQGDELVRGGFRLQPLRLPNLALFVPHPLWRGSLFDGAASR